MKQHTSFQKAICRDKGLFQGQNFLISSDSINWIHCYSLSITENGELYSKDENDTHYLLLQSLQSCSVQVFPTLSSSSPSASGKRKNKKTVQDAPPDEPPVVFIKTYDYEKLYVKVPNKNNFGNLILSLLVWQALRPAGLVKKWYCQNKVYNSTLSSQDIHELLVCRFKIYGPIPAKSKNLKIVPGPKAPVYQPKMDQSNDSAGPDPAALTQDIPEGWFYTMGVLKSNGILNFISELDGALLYSIDIKTVMSSEIREVHHLIFDSSNILFVGHIRELRWNNCIKTTTDSLGTTTFLTKDSKPVTSNLRVLIEFPLHIDLEDWFVGLNYFSKREYIGVFNERAETKRDDDDPEVSFAFSTQSVPPPAPAPEGSTTLADYSRENFRVLKKVSIDIIEAKFDHHEPNSGKIYAEVIMWGLPWSRTAIVNHTANPFWKEEFKADLPILTQIVHILIKKCLYSDVYLAGDKVIGTVYITPDILIKQLSTSSTMMVSGGNSSVVAPGANDIVRLSIYDSSNILIGKLLLNVNLKEYHVLPPAQFKTLESMLHNAPMKDLIKFCSQASTDFENVSLMLLDIFQSLGIEERWFKALMEVELVNVDKMTRKNYVNRSSGSSSSNNVFNTLFRGSSIFSKSLEKYNLRIGQEYLEKVFGDFFQKIDIEGKNCEVDPRYVRLLEKAERKGKTIEQLEEDDDSDSDSDIDEDERDAKIKSMVDENFTNLYTYAEEIWNKIYVTSNDLPEQIKLQLKNFRTKVDLACDPDDKVTALNCLSAFIFLRFFCPAILNPKLFYLTKNHQTGRTQRTLTLIAKILLNLANRQEFSPHKEPHLVKMNRLLKEHHSEVYDYFDKITGRKNDFNEKILDLSHDVKRFDLGLSGDSTSSELPTTPYLIDKYLRLTQLIHLLNLKGKHNHLSSIVSNTAGLTASNSSVSVTTAVSNENPGLFHHRDSSRESGDIHIDNEKNVYQIGSLEFEKSEFLDLVGDNETEGFIKSLCRSNENIFSFITSNITLKDLQKQSTNLMNKISDMLVTLEVPETPENYMHIWPVFADDILERAYLDTSRNTIVFFDRNFQDHVPNNYKKLTENSLSTLKLKFSDSKLDSTNTSMALAFSSNSLGSVLKSGPKNPFKKWLKR